MNYIMKDYIKELIDKNKPKYVNINQLRQYLQEYLLYILYQKRFYTNIVFCGGTALRFLFRMKRFSEDLDFSLSSKAKGYDFQHLLKTVKDEFTAAGYVLDIKYSTEKNVYKAFLKFSGLLYEFGLSGHKQEKFSIKFDIDMNPPGGGKELLTIVNKNFLFHVLHFDIPSLFAGKLNAILCRQYTKGRDWYDLLWYLTKYKDTEPNFTYLNAALEQTNSGISGITKENWKSYIKSAIDKLDIQKVHNDVFRFLEIPEEKELLTKENLIKALTQ